MIWLLAPLKSIAIEMDEIDWDISKEEVEKLKAKLVPSYWQSLQREPYSVTWLSSRLYIVQD